METVAYCVSQVYGQVWEISSALFAVPIMQTSTSMSKQAHHSNTPASMVPSY